jgi:hypothetical protein
VILIMKFSIMKVEDDRIELIFERKGESKEEFY